MTPIETYLQSPEAVRKPGTPALSLDGQPFGYWTVVRRVENNKNGRSQWLCRCICGTEKVVPGNRLTQGGSKSCGCKTTEFTTAIHITHGQSKKRGEYTVWQNMRRRCRNPKAPHYALYGGRGIRVCERWDSDFAAFLADMGLRPSSLHSIDRIDNERGYEPGNCRWATPREQAQNQRTNRLIVFRGETKCLAEWARIVGLDDVTLLRRLDSGWPVDRAMTEPTQPDKAVCLKAEALRLRALGRSYSAIAKELSIGKSTVAQYIVGRVARLEVA